MRHGRLKLGVVATLCAFAVAATPAMAHEFTGNIGKAAKAKGEGTQEFKFGVFKILCESSGGRGGGLNESPQKTFFLVVKYSHCSTEAHIGGEPFFLRTRFKTPVSFEYHANGFVESGSESEENVKLSGGAVEMKVAGLKCIIDWEAQTIPVKAESKPENEFSAASFTNIAEPTTPNKKFPDGFKHKLSIGNALKGMQYEYEEGACEEFEKTEGKNGSYKGTMLTEINAGNLEFS